MEKVTFTEEPEVILYMPQVNDTADVWLRKNIEIKKDTEGNEYYKADEVYFNTRLTKEEVMEQFDSYFIIEEPEPTIQDLVEALDIVTQIVLEG